MRSRRGGHASRRSSRARSPRRSAGRAPSARARGCARRGPTALPPRPPPRWWPTAVCSIPKRSQSSSVWAKSRAVTSTSCPSSRIACDQRPQHEHVRAVGQIGPDTHRVPATAYVRSLVRHAADRFDHGPDRQRRRGRRGCDGAPGRLPADGAGERLHTRSQRGHDAVRRLQRLERRVQPVRGRGRRARSPTWWAPGSPTGWATPAAWTSSRSTARSSTSRRATWSGPTAGSSATATPPSSSRACSRSSAPSSRCPPAWRACRSGASACSRSPGCVPWVLMLTFIGKQAGDNWEDWKDNLHYVDYVVAALIVGGVVYLLLRARGAGGGAGGRRPPRPPERAPAPPRGAWRWGCSRASRSWCRCRARRTWPSSRGCSAGATPARGRRAQVVRGGPPRRVGAGAGRWPPCVGGRRRRSALLRPHRAPRGRWPGSRSSARSSGRLGGPRTVALAQVAAGAALWLADRAGRALARRPDAGDHLAVGVAQALALVPGVSRAGAALTAAPAARALRARPPRRWRSRPPCRSPRARPR